MRRRGGWAAAAVVPVVILAACSTQDSNEPADVTTTVGSLAVTGTAPGTATQSASGTATQSSSSAATQSSPSSATPTEPAEPRSITVVMSGDMLLHEGLWKSAEIDAARTGHGGPTGMDYRPLLADMKPVVSGADLAICHMETPLAPPGGPYSGYPLFSAPPAIVPAMVWLGYDACTTASNHSIDQGFEGLTRTLDTLDAAGLAHAGTAATRRASTRPLVMQVDGVSVALISATYGTNGLPLPADEPWSVPLINPARIEAMAARAKDDGADIVMVALHWGTEYLHDPNSDQLAVADELTSSPDIDFIYGHHAHVVQPFDRVNGTWVVYGLGNAVAQQDTNVEGVYDGNTARVTFTERPDGSFAVTKLEYIPTMITPFDDVHPMRWLDVAAHLDDPAYASLQDQLQATQDRVSAVINDLGAFRRGVTEGD